MKILSYTVTLISLLFIPAAFANNPGIGCKTTDIVITNNSHQVLHYTGSNLVGGSMWTVDPLDSIIAPGGSASIVISSENVNDRVNLSGYLYFSNSTGKTYELAIMLPMEMKAGTPYLSMSNMSLKLTHWKINSIINPVCLNPVQEDVTIQ